jgi:sugar lactone lactonase YvrE
MLRSVRFIFTILFAFALSIGSIPAAKPAVKVECVAGCGGTPDGSAEKAQLIEPFGVAFDKQGNWYICEYKGQRITKVDTRGRLTNFAGGEGNQPSFHDPHGVVISKDQQMYIADTLNHRAIRIDLKTKQSSVIAGNGQASYSGDGGPAVNATFNQLYAVDLNRANDKLYITDLRNRRIRLLNLKSGVITTIAGNGQQGIPVDGAMASESPLVDPRAATIDSKGNLYILERGGNALRVMDRAGRIRTLIGPANPPRSKNGQERELNGPKQLCVDLRDNVIIADAENHLIRKYDPKDGTTVIIAGTGKVGSQLSADDPLQTQLNRPHGVFVHSSGALYLSDSNNHRILKLSNW